MAVCMEGPLSKWTNMMKGWQYRWFVLDDNTGLLSYYTSKDKMIRGSRRGCVRLQGAIIGIDDEEDSTFTITVDQKVFHFQARDSDDRKQWVCSLEDTILRHSQRKLNAPNVPSLNDFDRRLAEADAYLKLLLENIKGIENKLNAMDNTHSGKQDLEGILMTAQEMVEAVKKSVVLLQLAKMAVTTSCNAPEQLIVASGEPSDSTHGPTQSAAERPKVPAEPPSVSLSPPDKDVPSPAAAAYHENTLDSREEVYGSTPTSSTDSIDQPASASNGSVVDDTLIPVPSIPTVSYSSSEDEYDEFYDADDTIEASNTERNKEMVGEPQHNEVEEVKEENSDNGHPKVIGDNSRALLDNFQDSSENLQLITSETEAAQEENDDHMYMHEESCQEKEGESLEEHKSVIMHLLSQVKLGMDLTKVVLPTFILEKRSLLEMYADFFSHGDYFLAIAQKPTPEERMIASVRFYLSTFSAGRNSSVAKKPYNPILGETFQCFWNHSSFPTVTTPPVTVPDGPVPWAKSNQLSFIAEQVSHHPPVSAFYAEHPDQRIQFNGHIWTKSKFLGLSVGVHNIGQGCVRLLDLDEEYILTFPNGYGRSILTVPWFELGGDCTITCEKTGYNAFVKFHTKPFYGGKMHKVTGEIFKPNVKKPFCTLEGEWNTVMYCNHSSGQSERFVDAKRRKIMKLVRKIEYQEPTESRHLWQVVTTTLTANKIDEATDAKRTLEDKQRNDAKERLEKNITYKPKFFHEDDCQNWIYDSTLTDRMNS